MIAQIVYMLCAVTSVVCAYLLLNSYRANRSRLLMWSGLFFSLLAVSNILLFVDLVLVQQIDLSVLRTCITAGAHLMLVIGMISKSS